MFGHTFSFSFSLTPNNYEFLTHDDNKEKNRDQDYLQESSIDIRLRSMIP